MTSHVAVLPFTVVAVTVVAPVLIAVTFPCTGVTVATVTSLEVNWTDLSVESVGATVADNVSVAPTASVAVVLFKVMPDGSTLLGLKIQKLRLFVVL